MKLKQHNISYIDLLKTIDAKFIAMREAKNNPKERICCLRHDVDNSLDSALIMAELEYKNSISSTYFLLHTAGYFDYSIKLRDACKQLLELGHEVGLHNDAISVWLNTKENIKDIIEKPLNFLRDVGAEIVGTASHGPGNAVSEGFINYIIWKEADTSIHSKASIVEFKIRLEENKAYFGNNIIDRYYLSDFGLLYEACFFKYDAYLADSGSTFVGLETGDEYIKLRRESKITNEEVRTSLNFGVGVIDKFNKYEKGLLQCLFHPCWWGSVYE